LGKPCGDFAVMGGEGDFDGDSVAKVTIKRGGLGRDGLTRLRGTLALALMGAVASCVMPLYASRTAPNSLTIALDAPAPFDPATDLSALFLADAPAGASSEDNPPALVPTMLVPGPAASPHVFRGQNAQDMLRASMCLTAAIYYEAGNEPDAGQRAVAQVVLNRVRHPAYPDTVCGVVYQGTDRNDTLCQFTFGCDGSMARIPASASWARAARVAREALAGYVYAPAGLATHYHTLAVNPFWNKSLTPTAIVGAHIFYRFPGGAGAPKAFHASYRGGEPLPGPKPKLPLSSGATPPLVMADAEAFPVPPVSASPTVLGSTYMASAAPIRPVDQDKRYLPGALPESDIRPEYRNSGEWIAR
jgi:hypothetical protein